MEGRQPTLQERLDGHHTPRTGRMPEDPTPGIRIVKPKLAQTSPYATISLCGESIGLVLADGLLQVGNGYQTSVKRRDLLHVQMKAIDLLVKIRVFLYD